MSSSSLLKPRIALSGISGRMGRALIEAILQNPQVQLSGVLARPASPLIGQDAGLFMGQQTDIIISDAADRVLEQSDCLIDFTRPEATMEYVKVAQRLGTKLVIGTTGWTPEQYAELQHVSQTLPMVVSPNMSIGVHILFKLIEQAAQLLPAEYQTEIIEAHHYHKMDAPSGTALKMGQVIAKARDLDFQKEAVFSRNTATQQRGMHEIGFATVRAGGIVGEHTALFAGIADQLEITHRSANRYGYAQGALRAALFLMQKTRGLFDMQDVLAVAL